MNQARVDGWKPKTKPKSEIDMGLDGSIDDHEDEFDNWGESFEFEVWGEYKNRPLHIEMSYVVDGRDMEITPLNGTVHPDEGLEPDDRSFIEDFWEHPAFAKVKEESDAAFKFYVSNL